MRWRRHNDVSLRFGHRWFAWYPVTTDSGVSVWLENVIRKGTLHTRRDGFWYQGLRAHEGTKHAWTWEYQLPMLLNAGGLRSYRWQQ